MCWKGNAFGVLCAVLQSMLSFLAAYPFFFKYVFRYFYNLLMQKTSKTLAKHAVNKHGLGEACILTAPFAESPKKSAVLVGRLDIVR